MNHARYVYYWESFVKNPVAFINELKFAATLADKYGLKIIYDNHQFHTSSWLNPQRGTGFPHFLFQNNSEYAYGSGRSEEHTSELQSLMRISYALFCLKQTNIQNNRTLTTR